MYVIITHLRIAGSRFPTKAARLNVRKQVMAEKYFSGTAKLFFVCAISAKREFEIPGKIIFQGGGLTRVNGREDS